MANELRRKFRRYLKDSGYKNQKEFAWALNVAESTLSKWVNGHQPWPPEELDRTIELLELNESQERGFRALVARSSPPRFPKDLGGTIGLPEAAGIQKEISHSITTPVARLGLLLGVVLSVVVGIAITGLIRGGMSLRPSPAPGLIGEGGVCGESNRVEASAPELWRSQGVIPFNQDNTDRGILNDYVRAVTIDRRGVWIGYFATDQNPANGLGQYDGSDWADCDHSGATKGNVNAVAVDHADRVWVATEKDGVAMFDGKAWHRFTTRDGLPSDWTYGLTVDDDNNVWVATWEGVAKFDENGWSVPYTARNGTIFDDRVHAIAFDSAGNIWVGHIDQGVSQFRSQDGTWVHHTSEKGEIGGDKIRAIGLQKAGADSPEAVWFATETGLSKFEQGKWTVYRTEDGLPSNNIQAVAFDKYNRIWAATRADDSGTGGVAYLDGSNWVRYNTLSTMSLAFGPSCQDCPIDDEQVWAGTAGWGLTYSRIPYPDEAIEVSKVCFQLVRSEHPEPICPPLIEVKHPHVITVTYPIALAPGEKLRFEVTVVPVAGYQLREDRGDFLSYAGENDVNRFNAWPLIPVKGIVNPGQPFIFTDYNNPLVAPQLSGGELEKTFTSTWRVWVHTRYAGPAIRIRFIVRTS